MFRYGFVVAVALAGVSFDPTKTRADILITLFNTARSGPNTKYFYNVFLEPGYELDRIGHTGNESTGDLFTLYDFKGLIGTPSPSPALAANGFSTVTLQGLGITPVDITPPDSGAFNNITFKYTNPREIPAFGMELLGSFSVTSRLPPGGVLVYAAATQKSRPGSLEDDALANNLSYTVGPAASEPPSLFLLAGALLFLLCAWGCRAFASRHVPALKSIARSRPPQVGARRKRWPNRLRTTC
jgi:hypothetical protein